MPDPAVQRRAFPRAPLDGLARVAFHDEVHSYRISDVSYGGVGLRGDPSALRVGARVRIMLTCAVGRRLDTIPRLETWAIVRRTDDGAIGLTWEPGSLSAVTQINFLVKDTLAKTAS